MLNEAIEGFHERDPYRPFADTDPTTGENLVRVEIKENPPVLEWGVLIGDVLHNLRSSLDHLAYILGGDPPPNEGGSEFPIFWSRTDYRKKGAPKIVGACDHAQAVIEDCSRTTEGMRHELSVIPYGSSMSYTTLTSTGWCMS